MANRDQYLNSPPTDLSVAPPIPGVTFGIAGPPPIGTEAPLPLVAPG